MQVILTRYGGFCRGVANAVATAEKYAPQGVYILGELVHNELVTARLASLGAVIVQNPQEVPAGASVIIRSHGAGRSVYETFAAKNIRVIDCTCPFVKKIHDIVKKYSAMGYTVVVLGKKGHPEVEGILGQCFGECFVAEDTAFDFGLLEGKNVCVVAQTTCDRGFFLEFSEILDKKRKKTVEIFDTICYTTKERQEEAIRIARICDCVIVVGSRSSSNTRRLYSLVSGECKNAFWISDTAELEKVNLLYSRVGIVSGASTPDGLLREVFLKMENVTEVKALNEMEEAVAKMDEQSNKFRKGQTITATISSATDEGLALYINNTKKEILLPKEELVCESYNKEDYKEKVGEEIEVMIVGLNPVKLSEKAIAKQKEEEAVLQDIKDGKVFNVTVEGSNKGGLVGHIGTYSVFIPSSQIRIGYVKDLDKYIGKTLRCKAEKIESSERRKQIVASQRVILEAEKAEKDAARAAKEEAFFSAISVGDIIKGTVVRFAQFGAFVDVNGFDCLAHISDLSWTNIKNCGEVLELNKEYEFKILSIDSEKKKVSLGYKQLQPRPWDVIAEKYSAGDVIKGTVVRITKFGAFVEVEKGVDGLVHVSQISHEWLEDPTSAVSVGQEVDVKILNIDTEAERLTLSIKALQPVPEGAEQPRPKKESKPAGERKPRRNQPESDETREWNEDTEGGASIAELIGGSNND